MRWTERLSLRARLLIVVAALLAAALLLAGLLTVSTLESQLRTQVDVNLQSTTTGQDTLSRLIQQVRDRDSDGRDALPSRYVVQMNHDDGRIEGPIAEATPKRMPDLPYVRSDEVNGRELRTLGVGEHSWRAMVVPVGYDTPGSRSRMSSDTGTVVVALPMAEVHETVQSVAWRFALLSAALILILLLAGNLAIGRAFRPLREVQKVAAAFGGGDTSRRVQVTAPGSEVGELGTSMNAMLQQIETTLAAREASEARMRRFVGDASHELRTPLAAVRGFAELYRMGAVTRPEDVSHTFRRIEDESTRMGALVEDLLMLARMDAQRPMRSAEVDLLVLAADAAHDATALAPHRRVRVTGLDGSEPQPVPLTGDEARLRQVVTNLMANAVRHTPAGTSVELAVGHRDGYAVLEVVDHGAGIPPELGDRIFERFFRADDSRSRASGGTGLGLAIVAAIVAAHGGTTRLRDTPGGGATFVVTLPVTRAPSDSQPVPRVPSTPAQNDPVS